MSDIEKVTVEEIATTPAVDVITTFGSDGEKGLTAVQVTDRLLQFGPNSISTKKRIGFWLELLSHFKNPLVIILIVAATVAYTMGETVNASIIILMVLLSVFIDFFQERDARNAAEKLKESVRSKATVVRNGVEVALMPENICPGDIILLSAGNIIPADARIISSKDFYVNQSSLTGESFPCQKQNDVVIGATDNIADLTNMLFMGSSAITGNARAIVVKTGTQTEFGRIAEKLIEPEEETDFGKGMRSFGYLIMKVTIALVLVIFLINAVRKKDMLESFMFSIAVAVGLTPELLPMVMSVTMAKGSMRMAKKGVIVKRLSAIPNFGSMEVLCTDKTGTLTEDKIEMVKCVDIHGADSDPLFQLAYLNSFFQTGIKNPLDDAVVNFRTHDISAYSKIEEIPFDFNRKRMSVVVMINDTSQLICKGAPEEIFRVCVIDAAAMEAATEQYDLLSADGFRVLAIATKIMTKRSGFTKEDETGLTLQGFIAFLDPPKQDADEVVTELSNIGVDIKIITGDNYLVTKKICSEIGLPIKGYMQGHELEAISDEALVQRAVDTTIFTRCSPDQKNRIILALKKHHRAVGYMGDGINDAPSLKTADIGISVSSATDVTKEAADIILTQNDLLVLKEGILEGRKTFGNTMKYILMGLSSNFGNMFSVAAATLFLPYLPMMPVQILVNNFLYDTSQITIPSDNVDSSYVQRPQQWNLKMIRNYMFIFGLTSSVFDMATFYLLFSYFSVSAAQFQTGWFMESLATQILVVFIIRTSHLPFVKSRPSLALTISTLACLTIGWLLPYTSLGRLLGFEPLPGHILIFIISLVGIYVIAAEGVKRFIFYRINPAKKTLGSPTFNTTV